MKKNILLSIVIISMYTFSSAQTNIPAGNVSGTWTLTGSPYLIQGSITIPNDSILIIEPGVTVNFQGTYKLNVLGCLLAIGTSTDTIIFTAANTTNGWLGIRFDNVQVVNDSSKFFYCKLQYGKATGTPPDHNGGAFYFKNSSKVIISNCRIFNCRANTSGGGIYCNNSNPIISNNTISNNVASYECGGIYCSNSSHPTISNNTISNNSAFSGGGIICSYSNPTINNNTIYNNSVNDYGGGIYCWYGNPTISNNTISNNFASTGGGGIYGGNSNPTVINNIIFNNSSNYGGGIFCESSSSPAISNNTISNNDADYGGAIYCRDNSNLTISNNSISNNTANYYGGGIFCSNNNPTILNNTIAYNSAVKGGALYCRNISNPILRNTILWGNTANTSGTQVYLEDYDSDPNFYFCDVQGDTAAFELNGNSYTGIYQNNINSDPLFISPSAGSGTGFNGLVANWSLQSNSPCINTGDPNGTYSASDIVGSPRVIGGTIDIGAYEYQGLVFITASVSQTELIIYPNPAGDYVNVVINNNKNSETSISVFDILGNRLLHYNTVTGRCKTEKLDISNLKNGMYLVRIESGNETYFKKLMKGE